MPSATVTSATAANPDAHDGSRMAYLTSRQISTTYEAADDGG